MRSIALYGRTGSGKTTLGKLLTGHGFQHVKAGVACRNLCLELFDSEAKGIMNRVADALRAIDQTVWLRAALRSTSDVPFVFDSMRFPEDYVYMQERRCLTVKIIAGQTLRLRRLAERGQQYEPERDELHDAEVSLEGFQFDYTLHNEGDTAELAEWARTLAAAASDSYWRP